MHAGGENLAAVGHCSSAMVTPPDAPEPTPDERRRGSLVPIAIAALFALPVAGAVGVAIGAGTDDFPFGLRLGAAIGATIGFLIYWFALRDRRPRG